MRDPSTIPADVVLASLEDPSVLEPYRVDPIDTSIEAYIGASKRREAEHARVLARDRLSEAVSARDPGRIADAVADKGATEFAERDGSVDFHLQAADPALLESSYPDILLEGPDDEPETAVLGPATASGPLTPAWWTVPRTSAAYLVSLGLSAEEIAEHLGASPSEIRSWAAHPDFRRRVDAIVTGAAYAAFRMAGAYSIFAVRNIVAIARVGTKTHDIRLKASLALLKLGGVDAKRFDRAIKEESADALASVIRYINGQARVVRDNPESDEKDYLPLWDVTKGDDHDVLDAPLAPPTEPADDRPVESEGQLSPRDLLALYLGHGGTDRLDHELARRLGSAGGAHALRHLRAGRDAAAPAEPPARGAAGRREPPCGCPRLVAR